jgi:hypothetical protein
MKKLSTILGIFLFMTAAVSAQDAAKVETAGGAEITFESEVIDYGTIAHKSDGVRAFKFTNVGDAPIVITKVKGSCGCTVPTKPEGPIMPGESAEIGVKYATDRIGTFAKTVTVTSNASKASIQLKIKGNVLNSTEKEEIKSN